MLKMSSDISKCGANLLFVDESIEQYEYHKYKPITGTNLNNNGKITTSNHKTCSPILARAT